MMMVKLNEIVFDILLVEILLDFHKYQIIFSEYLVLQMDLIKVLVLVLYVVLKPAGLFWNWFPVKEVVVGVVEEEVEVDMKNKVYFDNHPKSIEKKNAD